MIKDLEAGKTLPQKKVISEEKGFDARTITQADIDTYGLGD
jgi:simple sugar transport system substrate-binding protein